MKLNKILSVIISVAVLLSCIIPAAAEDLVDPIVIPYSAASTNNFNTWYGGADNVTATETTIQTQTNNTELLAGVQTLRMHLNMSDKDGATTSLNSTTILSKLASGESGYEYPQIDYTVNVESDGFYELTVLGNSLINVEVSEYDIGVDGDFSSEPTLLEKKKNAGGAETLLHLNTWGTYYLTSGSHVLSFRITDVRKTNTRVGFYAFIAEMNLTPCEAPVLDNTLTIDVNNDAVANNDVFSVQQNPYVYTDESGSHEIARVMQIQKTTIGGVTDSVGGGKFFNFTGPMRADGGSGAFNQSDDAYIAPGSIAANGEISEGAVLSITFNIETPGTYAIKEFIANDCSSTILSKYSVSVDDGEFTSFEGFDGTVYNTFMKIYENPGLTYELDAGEHTLNIRGDTMRQGIAGMTVNVYFVRAELQLVEDISKVIADEVKYIELGESAPIDVQAIGSTSNNYIDLSGAEVTKVSSDPRTVEVLADGTLKAKKLGTAQITTTVNVGGYEATAVTKVCTTVTGIYAELDGYYTASGKLDTLSEQAAIVYARVNIINTSDDTTKKCTLIIAEYEEGILTGFTPKEVTLSETGKLIGYDSEALTSIAKGKTLQIYVWDNMDNIMPISIIEDIQ